MDASTDLIEAELLQLAAGGDRAATARLRDNCAMLRYAGVTDFELLCVAEAFGRLTAAHGHADDNLMLAGILRCRAGHVAELGHVERAMELIAQSEALCDKFSGASLSSGLELLAGILTAHADAGDKLAADRLNKLASSLSAGDANELRCTVNNACQAIERERVGINGALNATSLQNAGHTAIFPWSL